MAPAAWPVALQFEHTHLGAYLAGTFAVACLFSDSAQGLIERNQLNRKWLLLYGVLCIFAYLYARPFIRVGLGSAKRGYINFSTLYIVWLCSAVFYHLPSLEQLGLDVRADVSMLIVVFLSSLAALSLLAAAHTAAVSLRLLPRRAYLPTVAGSSAAFAAAGSGSGSGGSSGLRELWILMLLNSMIIAVACGTYHSFCGNGTVVVDGNTPAFKAAVCAKWLHPILTANYPRFASWMLYGEGSAHKLASSSPSSDSGCRGGDLNATLATSASLFASNDGSGGAGDSGGGGMGVDLTLDGAGVQSLPAGDVLSPVLSMWVTLVAVYIANTLAGQPRLVQSAAEDALSINTTTTGNSGTDINYNRSRIGRSSSCPQPSSSSASRRTPSFRRAAGGERQLGGGGAAAAGPAGGGGDAARKGRYRSLEVKRPISKGGLSKAMAGGSVGAAATAAVLAAASSAARGAAAAAARRSLSSLRGLAASTGRLKRAASDYLHASHPYLPALLGQVRRGMAALEPTHLAAELAEATGLPPDLARALTRGSSFSALTDSMLLTPPATALRASSTAGGGGLGSTTAAAAAGGGGGLPLSYWAGGAVGAAGGGDGQGFAFGSGAGVAAASAVGPLAPTPLVASGPPPQPEFLDMVPWYSGTSADLFKTLFDLMVSLKLFLGRFDMRTMQAATAASMADSFNDIPSEGDGFTYEHLDERPQLWLDFIADTGDGGNPTYAVAAALAAPVLQVTVPDDLPEAAAAAPSSSRASTAEVEERKRKDKTGAEVAGGGGGAAACAPPRPGRPLVLPRGDVLLVGGDLAYPNPSRETYQQRLFGPFSDALPPPPHFHAGRLVVHKPDLPPVWGVHEAALLPLPVADLRGLSPRSSRRASSAALRRYPGPTAFAIPGNHDWIDGLETFTRDIQHKGWLGGWLLPQEKSYFALRLPAGWWLFGFDLALVQDIDMQQYRYFANVVEQRMSPEDQVILITHEPLWLLEWFWQRRSGSNLRQLVRGHLRGRARLHLAGDLHFYMRHSWTPPQQQQQQQEGGQQPEKQGGQAPMMQAEEGSAGAQADEVGAAKAGGDSEDGDGGGGVARCAGRSSNASSSATSSAASGLVPDTPPPPPLAAPAPAGPGVHYHLPSDGDQQQPPRDPAPAPPPFPPSRPPPPPPQSHRFPRLTPPPHLHLDNHVYDEYDTRGGSGGGTFGEDADVDAAGGGGGGGDPRVAVDRRRRRCAACEARRRWVRHPHDPEHLVVNGGGGAFLHPTHVFAGARFPAPLDPAADATAGLYAAVALPCTCGIYSPGTALYGGAPGDRIGPWLGSGGWPPPPPPLADSTRRHPAGPFPGLTAAAASGDAAAGGGGGGGGIRGYASLGPDGEYVCAAAYPSPRTSMQLGRRNLHVFRLRNTRFDVIGGVFYFLLVVSVLPRCSRLAEVLEADTPGTAVSLLAAAYLDTLAAILGRSYLSAGALALLFAVTLGLAKGGGVGVAKVPSPSAPASAGGGGGGPAVRAPGPLLAARFGGFWVQFGFAAAHCMTHVSLAIVLLLLLELGVETCIKYERLGADGPHSLYRWYRAYEEQHFPDPMGLRQSLQRWTLGLYPGALQLAMGVYDVPELIAVARTAMCAAGGSLEPISRLQAVSYYSGMLAYYWLLATPAMGFVFGLYLYLTVCWCHVHYDEAFSSLREANCKSFCRLHIGPSGDLRLYSLALDEVPTRWQEDPRWRGVHGGGGPGVVAHEAHYPSRWLPARTEEEEERAGGEGAAQNGGGAAAQASKTAGGGGGGGGGKGAAAPPAAAATAAASVPSVRWRLVDYVFVPRRQL